MVFCNNSFNIAGMSEKLVTILILIDGFLQYDIIALLKKYNDSHNPYFNRWFSAILINIIKY